MQSSLQRKKEMCLKHPHIFTHFEVKLNLKQILIVVFAVDLEYAPPSSIFRSCHLTLF